MLHTKIMTVDGTLANIGSANLNSRSTALDEEINVVAIDPALVRTLDDQFDEDLARSTRVQARKWEHRSVAQRAAEAAIAPIKRFF
jgi:cardiolipin synthase